MARLARAPAERSAEVAPARTPSAAYTDAAHVLLRAGAGLLFLQHGLQKLFGVLGGTAAPLASQMGAAGVVELVGGGLLVMGLWTRGVALILALEMLTAFTIAHLPRGGAPIENAGELALLYLLVFLFLAAAGAGPASVDARLGAWRPARRR